MQRQSLIFRLGKADRVRLDDEEGTRISEVQLVDEIGELDFGIGATVKSIQGTGLTVTRRGLDLLLLAAAVYAADKRLNRAEISQDGWTREIDIHLPVNEPGLWNQLRGGIENMLGFLTGDLWRLAFRPATGTIIELTDFTANLEPSPLTDLCLFSGGLDSFIGAVNLLAKGRKPLLVSHSWVASDSSHQQDCLGALIKEYGSDRIMQARSRIGFGEQDLRITKDGETTERSRSFLFFCLAAAAASCLKTPIPTIVPENGFISLNIPLDPLRLGAFSTRTTHPYFMARFNDLLSKTGTPTQLENPYRHSTKGEMVTDCLNPTLLRTTVQNTVSCSSFTKARWDKKGWGHCGHCVPCLIRRAALLTAGIPDPTLYHLDNLSKNKHPSDQAEGEHIRSFQLAIHRLKKRPAAAPILVQKAGSLADRPEEIMAFAKMYCRGLDEVDKLLKGVRAVPHA